MLSPFIGVLIVGVLPAVATPLCLGYVKDAKLLGISERSLWYRVKKLKIQVRGAEDEIGPA